MILITGAAGFIGSCMVAELNRRGLDDLILIDDFSQPARLAHLSGLKYRRIVERTSLFDFLEQLHEPVSAIFHLGARTDTAEQDEALFDLLNVSYTKRLWTWATQREVPFLYASSAATYGDGSLGFSDEPGLIPNLRPLNPYGWSKQRVDEWVLQQTQTPPRWVGLKFFNVYGPHESHKGRMASVVFHAFPQVRDHGSLRLFRSHRAAVADGEQQRDFIYVRDVVEVMANWLEQPVKPGIYNLGTGRARTFLDLGRAVFVALKKPLSVEFIDIPADIREAYQYFTEAEMARFFDAGFHHSFRSLEEGVEEYVQEYLISAKPFR